MKYHAPLDPECPVVEKFQRALDGDLMGQAMGAPMDEIYESFERAHRGKCHRCQEFGAANIEVV